MLLALDLSKVKWREALRYEREPHWQRIRPGGFLGYRPSAREGLGNWIARAYDEDRRIYRHRSLGDLGHLSGKDRFAVAKREAENFFELLASGGFAENPVETVEEACRRYATGNKEVEGRFERQVYSDPISKIKVAKLRRHHLEKWRKRLEAKPALITRRKNGVRRYRPRAPSSINRDMAALRAALNKVIAHGAPDTEAAWQEALRSIRHADRQRTLYLDRDQRRALIAAVDSEIGPFVRTLCLLPLRPGAAANLNVSDFDIRTSELTIGRDKSGKSRRILVSQAIAALFAEQVKNKLPSAPLLSRLNGKSWKSDSWRGPIKRAVSAAGLPLGTTAYTLRHSTITDLVNGGLPLLAVAQISDTSAEMIERHYGHLCKRAAAEALATLAI